VMLSLCLAVMANKPSALDPGRNLRIQSPGKCSAVSNIAYLA
jgi:hypothetical protein